MPDHPSENTYLRIKFEKLQLVTFNQVIQGLNVYINPRF
jgi:hypothetical protein